MLGVLLQRTIQEAITLCSCRAQSCLIVIRSATCFQPNTMDVPSSHRIWKLLNEALSKCLLPQRTIQEAITLCSCKAMHDPYGVQHFYLARMEEGRRLSKQQAPQPQAMEDMMTTVLVSESFYGVFTVF